MPGPVALEVRYAAGAAALLGAGSRWLLIDVADPDDPFLETVWDLLTAPTPPAERVLAAVDERYGVDRSLVLVDLTPGAETTVARGSGRAANFDGTPIAAPRRLTPAPGTRRLVSGIVAARAPTWCRSRCRPGPVATAEAPQPAPAGA